MRSRPLDRRALRARLQRQRGFVPRAGNVASKVCSDAFSAWRVKLEPSCAVFLHDLSGFALALSAGSNGWSRVSAKDHSFVVWNSGIMSIQKLSVYEQVLLKALQSDPSDTELIKGKRFVLGNWVFDMTARGIVLSCSGRVHYTLTADALLHADGEEHGDGQFVQSFFNKVFEEAVPGLILTLEDSISEFGGYSIACISVGGDVVASINAGPHQSFSEFRALLGAELSLRTSTLQLLRPDGTLLDRERNAATLSEIFGMSGEGSTEA